MNDQERETINRTIHEWLGHCAYYPIQPQIGPTYNGGCSKCGKPKSGHAQNRYDSERGFWWLLEGLEAKGCEVKLRLNAVDVELGFTLENKAYACIFPQGDGTYRDRADTLPLALVAAVVKLIENESSASTTPSDDSPNDQSGGTNHV